LAIETYRTLESQFRHETDKVKGSRFLATVAPASNTEEAQELVERVRREFHDARHHCSAWRFGLTGQAFRYSDDGEPSGSAGKPLLQAIDGRELVDVAVVVTRWFGGTKLGVGGLVRAYGGAAAEALDLAETVVVTLKRHFKFEYAYECSGPIQGLLSEFDFEPKKAEYGAEVVLWLDIPLPQCDAFLREFTERTAGRGIVKENESH
jgi:uncharacterized YigZ family protein